MENSGASSAGNVYVYGGDITAKGIADFFAQEENKKMVAELREFLRFKAPEAENTASKMAGLTFVITGSLRGYENRDALKALIEAGGGKVAGSVSRNTDYLINNDLESGSSKNRTAKELGIPIIDEEGFAGLFL